MSFSSVTADKKSEYNSMVSHPLQSYEWGEFREKTGVKVVRRAFVKNGKITDGFQLTIHKIPRAPFTIGYLPKGNMPTKEVIEELRKIGKEERCIFIQLEPNIIKNQESRIKNQEDQESKKLNSIIHDSKFKILDSLTPSAHPLFTKYTFELDLTKPEDELLKNMHPKTRYNIRIAQKRGVEIKEDNSEEAFTKYLELTRETTKRQKFYAHTDSYHKLMWQTLRGQRPMTNDLMAHLLTAKYQNKTITTWILFTFKDTLYYPYGASSSEHREVMASNLIMWEAILFGKKLGLKKFDMWGALARDPDSKDPWYGFHRFKSGYGPKHIEFVGSFDLIINPTQYAGYKLLDKLRWVYLRALKSLIPSG